MLLAYRILIGIALVIGSPFLLVKAVLGKHGIRERLGYIKQRESAGRLFWFHAASVGELKIIQSIMPEILRIDDRIEMAVSTSTITGRRRAAELFGERAIIMLQPLELKSSIERALNRLRPEKLIIVETEIWPLMLDLSRRRGIDLYLVNARMRKKSFGKYRLLRPFFGRLLENFSIIMAQSSDDAARFKSLGAKDVIEVGNLKYDQILDNGFADCSRLSITKKNRLVFVAGSVRKGEDVILADVIEECRRTGRDTGFVIVPRHMKEIDDICSVLASRGISFKLRSESPGDYIDIDNVLVVNTMGELRDFYKAADLTFVGGSLVPIGGHDPLEPASLGKPVIFGPFMENAREAVSVLIESGGAAEVKCKEDIIDMLKDAEINRDDLRIRGRKCREAVLSMTGASKKTAQYLLGGIQ